MALLPERKRQGVILSIGFAMTLMVVDSVEAADITAAWVGGDGLWTDSTWDMPGSGATYPNNTLTDQFDVKISNGKVELLSSAPPIIINSLTQLPTGVQNAFIVSGSLTTGSFSTGADNPVVIVHSGGQISVTNNYDSGIDARIEIGNLGVGQVDIGGNFTGSSSGAVVGPQGQLQIGGNYATEGLIVKGGSVTINGGFPGLKPNIRVDNGGLLSVGGNMNLFGDHPQSFTNRFVVDGATATIGGELNISNSADDPQTFFLSTLNGGTLSAQTISLSKGAGDIIASVSGSGSKLNVSDVLTSNASLSVLSGGNLTAGSFSNYGLFEVKGAGSTAIVQGNYFESESAPSSITNGGVLLVNGDIHIGEYHPLNEDHLGENGPLLDVKNSGNLTVHGDIKLNFTGDTGSFVPFPDPNQYLPSTLRVQHATATIDGTLRLGDNSVGQTCSGYYGGVSCEVQVKDQGKLTTGNIAITRGGALTITNKGLAVTNGVISNSGKIDVSSGGTVKANGSIFNGSTVDVSGIGSLLTTKGNFTSAEGATNVKDGGSLVVGGALRVAQGDLTVEGYGSFVKANLYVGGSEWSSTAVKNGAILQAGTFYVGDGSFDNSVTIDNGKLLAGNYIQTYSTHSTVVSNGGELKVTNHLDIEGGNLTVNGSLSAKNFTVDGVGSTAHIMGDYLMPEASTHVSGGASLDVSGQIVGGFLDVIGNGSTVHSGSYRGSSDTGGVNIGQGSTMNVDGVFNTGIGNNTINIGGQLNTGSFIKEGGTDVSVKIGDGGQINVTDPHSFTYDNGILTIALGGLSSFDALLVSGDASFTGTQFLFDPTYWLDIVTGTTLDFATFGGVLILDNVSCGYSRGTGTCDILSHFDSMTGLTSLEFLATSNWVPEPSSVFLFGIGLAGFLASSAGRLRKVD